MEEVFKIHVEGKLKHAKIAQSVSCLLMTWQHKESVYNSITLNIFKNFGLYKFEDL